MEHNSSEYLYHLSTAMTLALEYAQDNIADPAHFVPVDKVLSKEYARGQRALVSSPRTLDTDGVADTTYVAVVDEQRNIVSMMSSLFKPFGSAVTVPETGLLLQNRGAAFRIDANHPNRLAPHRRPYHTVMPAMIVRNDKPWACLGIVGGMMQPQGQLQIVCNLVDFNMNPQSALDAPRFRVTENSSLALESGISSKVCAELLTKGHTVSTDEKEGFGAGQLIIISDEMLYGGSDYRRDGCALGF
jgi:gamma-glutamyltranspeptidase/glutathione hydrolase